MNPENSGGTPPPQQGQPQQYAQPGAPTPYGNVPAGPTSPVIPLSARFEFDGGAGTYFGTGILAFIIVVFTLGICTPWAICIRYRWRVKHTLIDGYRLKFTGRAIGLFGQWVKWFLLMIITVGIYSFWVVPRLNRWIVRHQQFDMSAQRVV